MLSRRTFLSVGGLALANRFLIACRAAPTDYWPLSEKTITLLRSSVPIAMQRFAVPGASVALISSAKLIWSQGFGVKSTVTKDPVNTNTVFEAASMSKPVFASIVLRLCEEKKLGLDESLADYFRIPDLQNEPQVNLITPRIVLSHMTGLQNWRPGTEPLKIRFKPGTDFSYSGEAYVRLQRAVEKRTGESLSDLARTYVFEPLGMKQSSYAWRNEFEGLAAEGHNADGKIVRTRLWKYSPDSPQAMKLPPGVDIPLFAIPNAAASLYSTPTEYANFMIELMKPGSRLRLSEDTLNLQFRPVAKVNSSMAWGLGWAIADVGNVTSFWHWGNNDVYQCFALGARKEKCGLVIMTNSANGLKLCRDVVATAIGAQHPAFSWPMVLKG